MAAVESDSAAHAGRAGPSLLDRASALAERARAELLGAQRGDGHWVFHLEADATIPSEYILLNHFLDELDPEVEARLANYIRGIQNEEGGWPLFEGGETDLNCTVKAYYALKITGDPPDAPHMARARAAVLKRGGAARCNVFTRIALALFGQVPWRAVPSMPIEIMFLPRWFPFHLDKVSYWSRTTIVPLLILMALKPRARNPRGVGVRELFVTPPEEERRYFAVHSTLGRMFYGVDRLLKLYERIQPGALRRRGIDAAVAWSMQRLNGEDGLGAIFPPMANLLMALDQLGYPPDDPVRRTVRRSIDLLLTEPEGDRQFCQPCVSPIWDTGLAALAALEAGEAPESGTMRRAADWLKERQILDVEGDWIAARPGVRPGGWAFQYHNDYYPDVDDTAVVGMALHRIDTARYAEPIARAAEWIIGMQSRNGGWGAFDADNENYHLNHIPFADHGALLDPPTADVSARCVSFLCQIGYGTEHPTVKRGLDYLRKEQEESGAWFGRWGTNYIYGTWSALCAFNAAGEDPQAPHIRKAVAWLNSKQNDDGGWGETGDSYYAERIERSFERRSTASQTAWAVLALMAAGEVDSEPVRRGIAYLVEARRDGLRWHEEDYTAVGFPRVFYLRYHGYAAFFPLWALSRYRELSLSNERRPRYGM
ncbi:MAG: squalene--hopene cyclase [Alphaproteobacteria bacterium]